MVYDATGQLVLARDEDDSGVVSSYAYGYDRLGRLISVDNLGTPGPHVALSAGYDANGNRTSLGATIDGVEDFRNEYVYDNLNRQKSVRQFGQLGNAVDEKRVDFLYDSAGQWEHKRGHH
jgi:YD repeat-containing protein